MFAQEIRLNEYILFAFIYQLHFEVFDFVYTAENVPSWQLSLGIARKITRHTRQIFWCFFVGVVWGIILPLFTNALWNMWTPSPFFFSSLGTSLLLQLFLVYLFVSPSVHYALLFDCTLCCRSQLFNKFIRHAFWFLSIDNFSINALC